MASLARPRAGPAPARATLIRELGEELGVRPVTMELLGHVEDLAALERVPMRMTVFTASLDSVPQPAAELAALGWTTGSDRYRSLLAPAVRNQVIPFLRRAGLLSG